MTTPNINAILRHDRRDCHRGAPLGDVNKFDPADPLLYVQYVHFPWNDCYGPDGTYWGFPANLWCGFNQTARVYVRAKDREEAIAEIRKRHPEAKFKRSNYDNHRAHYVEQEPGRI